MAAPQIMFDECGALRRVLLRSPRVAFADAERLSAEWQALNFTAVPDLARACVEFDRFTALLREAGVDIIEFSDDVAGLTLDSIYVRDASIVTPRGVVVGRMGKSARRAEPDAQARALERAGVPVIGAIAAPGTVEGGDVVWFDERTVAVGRGYRTNDEGVAQFRGMLGGGVEVIVVPLPHYRGPGDVFHLMSVLSPVDRDLAVAYSPLMPVPFREWLLARGMTLVEVPDAEFASMGANVLAVAPRRVVMLAGNAITAARLVAAGVEVVTYAGEEISRKGGGGPTCLTRPVVRG